MAPQQLQQQQIAPHRQAVIGVTLTVLTGVLQELDAARQHRELRLGAGLHGLADHARKVAAAGGGNQGGGEPQG